MLSVWQGWSTRFLEIHFHDPMDLHHLGAIRKGPAITGNACRVGANHRRISEDRSERIPVMTDGYHRPALVSLELREREAIRYFDGVLILRGNEGLRL
jgi:hypothetical protein